MIHEIVLPSYAHIVYEEGNKAMFEIGGLHPGYGHTIGNSLRRILLSSLEGSSVTAVRFEGVNHEFSTIPHVKEDVLTILLNLKQVRFRMLGDEPQTAHISVRGEKEVTSADIKTPTQLEVIDGSIHIATLTEKNAELKAEIMVGKGLGYVPREELQKSKVDIGMLTLDAAYSPVRRVNYEVENMRVGERTDYNRLRLFIETDGTITPEEAFRHAVEICTKQLNAVVSRLSEKPIESGEVVERADAPQASEGQFNHSEDSVGVLELSDRVGKALEKAGINTIGQLVSKDAKEVKAIPGIGAVALQEIRRAVGKFGFVLGE